MFRRRTWGAMATIVAAAARVLAAVQTPGWLAARRDATPADVVPSRVRQTAPNGVTDLEVSGDLLDRAAFGGPEPRPSPFAAPPWWYATLAVPLLLAVLALARWGVDR